MMDLVEKGILTFLGAWLLLHEKAHEVIVDLIEKGKAAPEEGKYFIEDLSKRVDEEKEELKKKISECAHIALKEAGFATDGDVKMLTRRLNDLEKRLKSLEKGIGKEPRKSKM
ncbi:MAG: hypothetical protein QMD66_00855 [Actinomycetota bacterium]|nr:hypothetical protein [Actinomycetota bacterium]MDI6821421.1 hypothetical protein [Actinomycetota bacterium]